MKRKLDKSLTPNVLEDINEDIAGVIASYSSVKDLLNVMYASVLDFGQTSI